jgi:hypothetical protein
MQKELSDALLHYLVADETNNKAYSLLVGAVALTKSAAADARDTRVANVLRTVETAVKYKYKVTQLPPMYRNHKALVLSAIKHDVPLVDSELVVVPNNKLRAGVMAVQHATHDGMEVKPPTPKEWLSTFMLSIDHCRVDSETPEEYVWRLKDVIDFLNKEIERNA